MIYYIVATKDDKDNDKDFNKYLKTSLSTSQLQRTQIISNSLGNSIFNKYNLGISNLQHLLQDDDIVCFVHPDVILTDPFFEKKVEMVFQARQDIGMIGVYGTTVMTDTSAWWLSDRKQNGRGHIIQGLPDKPSFHMIDRIGFFDDIVSLDGCCLIVKGEVVKKIKFDEETFKNFHHYDCDYSFQVQEAGYKIAVVDILIQHQSEGPMPKEWYDSRLLFLEKWRKKGFSFPVSQKDFGL